MSTMGTSPILVDFNTARYVDEKHTRIYVSLETLGAAHDLKRFGITLEEGLRLHLYDRDAVDGKPDNLVATGVAHYDEQLCKWVAVVDDDAVKHVSEVRDRPDHWAASIDWANHDAEPASLWWRTAPGEAR